MDLMDANPLFSIILLCFSAAAAAKSLQSCLTLCDPIDSSPLGSTVPGILQARTLEWVAIAFSAVFLPSTCVFEMEQTALYHICTRFPVSSLFKFANFI